MLCLSMESYSVDLVKPAAASTKPSTKGVTFRLSTEKLEQLRRAADARNISSNTLFNQILKAYLDWHQYF
jgi:predicted HicB family RNase H-like nuclease